MSQQTQHDTPLPHIDLMNGEEYPLPLNSEDEGSLWRCGDYIVSWQKSPKTVLSRAAELLGKKHTASKVYPYTMMAFARAYGPSFCPSVILSLEVLLDVEEGTTPPAVVRMTLADRSVILGELPQWKTLPEKELQQLFFNTMGDFFGISNGETIRYLGTLASFETPYYWSQDAQTESKDEANGQ